MAQNEHINESILSDEVRQDMKKERIDHMTYLPGMEVLDSGIGQQVLDRTAAYDYNRYTADDVRRALRPVFQNGVHHGTAHRHRCRTES